MLSSQRPLLRPAHDTAASKCRGHIYCALPRRNTRSRCRVIARSSTAAPEKAFSLPYSAEPNTETDLSECEVSTVIMDNEAHPLYTQVFVQSSDSPGLLRVLSWVLNGMSVRVQHATLETSEDGTATDTLWVTDFRGRKLKDSSAESLGSRLEDFLITCGTSVQLETKEWRCGAIEISNAAHPELTQVIIRGEPSAHKPGFLLELATALTGVGASVVSGAIQGSDDPPCPDSAVAEPGYDFKAGRYFKFMMRGPTGGQMDKDRVACLIFTLRLLQGKGTMPTVAPNMDALLQMQGPC